MKRRLCNGICLCLMAVFLLWQGCTKPTLIGSDLLDEEIADLGFTDTFRMRMITRTEDSVITYSAAQGAFASLHICGNLNDPFFGRSSSQVHTQVFLNGDGSDFLDKNVDSVVLTLAYDTTGLYGNLEDPVTIEVFRISSMLDNTQDYFSSFMPTKGHSPIGELENFIPQPYDSLTIIRGEDTTEVAPMLRIPLRAQFISTLLQQTPGTFMFSDSFQMWLDGINVEMSAGDNTMLSFNLSAAGSGMTIYYSDPIEETLNEYRFVFIGSFAEHVHLVSFTHDYTGSVAENFIDNEELSDSLLFIQSMSGLNAEMEIIGLEDLDDVLINQAILEIYIAEVPEDDTLLFPLAPRLITRTFSDSLLINSVDVRLALNIRQIDLFGGTSIALDTTGLAPRKYVMNITSSVQDIVNGDEPNQIFISSFVKQNQPHRVILYGPGHSQYPARLRLTFTKVR